ncbi:hypothetical protein XENTR_v10004270 [Xenopus tropicalis]|nr:hypothetical protein XENTR_v10004270 [Xenopus tropicalis]
MVGAALGTGPTLDMHQSGRTRSKGYPSPPSALQQDLMVPEKEGELAVPPFLHHMSAQMFQKSNLTTTLCPSHLSQPAYHPAVEYPTNNRPFKAENMHR